MQKKIQLTNSSNGYQYSTALALSVFLGVLGIDRFYLGYIGVGIFKLCTCGFFGALYWLDVMRIITQELLPVDGSAYIVGYNGPRHTRNVFSNETSVLM